MSCVPAGFHFAFSLSFSSLIVLAPSFVLHFFPDRFVSALHENHAILYQEQVLCSTPQRLKKTSSWHLPVLLSVGFVFHTLTSKDDGVLDSKSLLLKLFLLIIFYEVIMDYNGIPSDYSTLSCST